MRFKDKFLMSDLLNKFLAENESQAFRMAQFATGNRDDALDIVQEAMIKLVKKYRNLPEQEWPPLFHRILQRQIADWYRSKKIRQKFFGWLPVTSYEEADKVLDYVQDLSARTPEVHLLNEQAVEVLQMEFQLLPLRQRQAFLLRCWQGLDTAQTAEAMGCSTGSVKTHYHRALTVLRKKLGETWP
jgi:RNA polymerase sigma-70 factor (ECF subfamily)